MSSPAVHEATSLEDALNMLDSHVPLTFRERKMIITSLYDLAFRDGAKQGRQAGTEAVQNIIRGMISALDPSRAGENYAITVLQVLLPVQEQEVAVEYTDTTTVIRRHLEDKQRAIGRMNQRP